MPTIEQFETLTDITDDRTTSYEEKVLYNKWVEHQQKLNAEIKTKNDIMKKARDQIISRGGDARQDIISTLMGAILEDMSLDSQQRVKTWIRKDTSGANYDASIMASNLEEAYKMQDWLFIFEDSLTRGWKCGLLYIIKKTGTAD